MTSWGDDRFKLAPRRKRYCSRCGREFFKLSGTHKFCSVECRNGPLPAHLRDDAEQTKENEP
jgi:hypothetical protein